MRLRLALLLPLAAVFPLPAQMPQAAQPAAYDVSTIKPHPPGDDSTSWYGLPDGVRISNIAAQDLIAAAWDLRPDQVTGGPDWVRDARWDFTAKATELDAADLKGLPAAEKRRMLQAVLTERLGLKVHQESRMANIYSLLPARSGIKLKPLVLNTEEQAAYKKAGQSMGVSADDATMTLSGHGTGMPNILRTLANNTRRTIFDKTGLPAGALYNFNLRFTREGEPTDSADAPPPLPTALEEQLGLHLEAGRGPEPVLLIDAVQKPTEN
jgi:uncharacterized protein (TIGR03435 family)